ncbi:hypothetical protein [Cellvibrio japonicus]|uniref:VanZ-like domain-containing protein n=1 Tax=Cellvibrio japonicus (strain Ueda107) TaxID=498211 RepID=B3PCD1_CELJU|nr:hypothetical protein [Cellvibrio japonicus]ACE86370.1 hypothetical protein CJA_1248 [Cellvibrio japonicus Ueda107]QEI11839.1 hypothetical protein FY117_06075 [Cellvibrio japonicus]QEI15413.1 hypothetical protein FY116_06075 [Cellvibrio japonicus]QEI18992.1 hypothetical protein FY115_06075 [Cellvibrio japonicus]
MQLVTTRQLLVGLLVVLVSATPLFFIGGPDGVSPPLYQALWDCGHILFFAFLGAAIHLLLSLRQSALTLPLVVGWSLAVLFAGGLIELAQGYVGRNADWQDVFNNLVGLWLGMAWIRPERVHWRWRLPVLLLMIPSLMPVVVSALVQWQQARTFPLLAGFESSLELQRINGRVEISPEHFIQGEHALKVSLGGTGYSGAHVKLFQGDWSVYAVLAMELYNPGATPLSMTLRISDRQHERGEQAYNDRFNRSLVLLPGWNRIRIPVKDIRKAPAKRQMNLGEIHRIGIFATRLPAPAVVYWDNLRLE